MNWLETQVIHNLIFLLFATSSFAQEQAFNLKYLTLDPASTIPPSPTVANLIEFQSYKPKMSEILGGLHLDSAVTVEHYLNKEGIKKKNFVKEVV